MRTQEASSDTPDPVTSEPSAPSTSGKPLIVYFSVMETDGVDTVGSASRVVSAGNLFGNNEYVAQLIQRETGGDVFAIETVQDYPTTHQRRRFDKEKWLLAGCLHGSPAGQRHSF